MSNDNKVLSQEEIDAMLSGGMDDGDDEGDVQMEAPSPPPAPKSESEPKSEEAVPEPAPASVAVAEPPVSKPVPEPVAAPAAPPSPVPAPTPVAHVEPVTPPPDPTPVPVQKPVPELAPAAAAVSSEALNTLTERMDRLEAAVAESHNYMLQMHQEFQTFTTQVQLISSRMEGVLDNLKSTLGYRAQKTFICDSCETESNVAAKVKCTNCSKENWWGWWPHSE